jgi:hypothetical protein
VEGLIEACPITVVAPNDFGAADEVRVAVGESATDGFRGPALNLKPGIRLLCGMAAPGYGKVCHEAVVVKRVGHDRAGTHTGIFKSGGPSFGDGVSIDPGGGRHDAKPGLAGAGHPPTMLHDGKSERPAGFVIGAKVVVGGDTAFLLLLHPSLGFLEFFGSRRAEKHRDGEAVVLHRRNHGEGDVPGIVADIAEHGQTAAGLVSGVKIRGKGPLSEVGEAVGFFGLSFGFGERGQKEAGENGNDRDDDEQFNQGEAARQGNGFCAGISGLQRVNNGNHFLWLS